MNEKLKWCEWCQQETTQRIFNELEYSDGADETHIGNHLVDIEYGECSKCGEIN